jgi:catechol 2,3-dioxygenase-like lactoylglutathione lyase family enzyme
LPILPARPAASAFSQTPSTGRIDIHVELQRGETLQLQLRDLTGRSILQGRDWHVQLGGNRLAREIFDLPAGVYMLALDEAQGQVTPAHPAGITASAIIFTLRTFTPLTYKMPPSAKSIRPFIGARDYDASRRFYQALGFEETVLSPAMSVFEVNDTVGFYLQNAYVKDWVDNTMIFLEVDDVRSYFQELQALGLPDQYPGVRLIPVREEAWGRECFLHDPSGILWHIGEFH